MGRESRSLDELFLKLRFSFGLKIQIIFFLLDFLHLNSIGDLLLFSPFPIFGSILLVEVLVFVRLIPLSVVWSLQLGIRDSFKDELIFIQLGFFVLSDG